MVNVAKNRILVVDDEIDMRNGLQKILSRKGYSVDTAEDGIRAVEKMKQSSFQVVIADLKMPRMDGIGVLRRAKDIDHSIAVIVITGYGTITSAVESMKLGAFDYIAKPFKPDDISLVVERALEKKRLLPEEERRETLLPEVTSTSFDKRTRTNRKPEQIKERRILLEHCEETTAQAVEERIVTPENISLFAEMYPNMELHLWQWIPFGASNADIKMYMKRGGYKALEKVLAGRPESVIAEIKESGLIGRGGAGFPTGLKWEAAFNEAGTEKYFVCNAEEGEPGTFKDKMLLDQNPHKVIEGMIIGAYAIGSSEGFLYIKDKYGDSADLVEKAVGDAQARGFLGKNILGSSFSFTLRVLRMPSAYVCGEETALCRSIEGKRAVPKIKPPFPTISGLFEKPTVINNVETLANVPHIISNGAKWFRSIGVDGSFGTKLFSITGNVKNSGVFEVELGKYTLGDLIYGLANGIESNRKLKAVLPGGPSTCFISGDNLDVVMDYKSMERMGNSLGSGAIIVLDETVSIPELVKHFFDFYQKQSCGDCVPCRVGTKKIEDLFHLLTESMGLAEFRDWHRLGGPSKLTVIETLKRIGTVMKKAAKCGLGQAAPEPLLSSIKLFEQEYCELIAQRQEEYERFVENSSASSNRGSVSDPVRSIMRRIDL
jgi:NADH:ubiquinone oxidoreductase subunit F (NADH-binding)/DNA-binding response OmpR family regulator